MGAWITANWCAGVLFILGLVLTIAVIWPVTDLIAAHDVGAIAGPARAARLPGAREVVRTQLLTLGAGLFAAGALVYTGLNFRLSRQGQVTDRYTKAIEQLGSDKVDVRIGGIYALERVARDSARDHSTVMEVLTAFIREHSWEQQHSATKNPVPPERKPRPDVQAAITVIGRRNVLRDRGQINLAGANLAGADMREADLSGATFFKSELTNARFFRAKLAGALFYESNLTRAILIEADLGRANMTRATLTDAEATEANLSRANLVGADLAGAGFARASLTQAGLLSANLVRADFTDADLSGATFPSAVAPPDGWVRDPESTHLIRGTAGQAKT